MPLIEVELPWPPSVNHYWETRGKSHYLSKHARAWHTEAWALIRAAHAQARPYRGPVAITVLAWPPDRRRRDIDNLTKPLLDALVHGGVLADDHQVDELHVVRRPRDGRGRVLLRVERV